MKYSHRLSDAVHILTYLEIYHGQKISSQDLAASADANPSLIRSLIAKMVKAGILKPKSDAPARPLRSRCWMSITQLKKITICCMSMNRLISSVQSVKTFSRY